MGRSLIFLLTIVRDRDFGLRKQWISALAAVFLLFLRQSRYLFKLLKETVIERERDSAAGENTTSASAWNACSPSRKLNQGPEADTRYSQKSPSELNRPRINKRFLPLNCDAVADINVPYLSFETLVTSFLRILRVMYDLYTCNI